MVDDANSALGPASADGARVFSFAAETEHPRDFRLLMNGPVNGYRDSAAMGGDVLVLSKLGYKIERFDCSRWVDESAMHTEVATRLDFPGYYGRNLAALNDCLTDTDVLDVPANSGLTIALESLDTWSGPQDLLVAILAEASRYWSLFGRRIVVLITVADRSWKGPTHLAGTRVSWWS